MDKPKRKTAIPLPILVDQPRCTCTLPESNGSDPKCPTHGFGSGKAPATTEEWARMAGRLANCLRQACDAGLRKGSVMDEADAALLAYRKLLDKPIGG
jgi:hypothetical protein